MASHELKKCTGDDRIDGTALDQKDAPRQHCTKTQMKGNGRSLVRRSGCHSQPTIGFEAVTCSQLTVLNTTSDSRCKPPIESSSSHAGVAFKSIKPDASVSLQVALWYKPRIDFKERSWIRCRSQPNRVPRHVCESHKSKRPQLHSRSVLDFAAASTKVQFPDPTPLHDRDPSCHDTSPTKIHFPLSSSFPA
jgi:hypothetical protein